MGGIKDPSGQGSVDAFNEWWDKQDFPGTHIAAAFAAWCHLESILEMTLNAWDQQLDQLDEIIAEEGVK